MGEDSMVKIRDKIIPLINKASVVGTDNVIDSENIIIILENEDKQKAFKVDNVLERREILIKNISDTFIEQKQIMGGAILGDGKVALILDIESILNYEQHEELG
jgi:two-component system chemotaxis sensor kinase CheA